VNETQACQIRRRRDFIRAHHPDRGGAPEVFMAGLRVFDTGPDDPGPLPAVVAVRRRPWLTRQVAAAARRLRYGPRPPRVRL